MKKILGFSTAIAISLVMVMSPVAFATTTANSGGTGSNWLYYPNNVAIALANPTNPFASPNSLPYCQAGSGLTLICYTPAFLRAAYNYPSTLDGTGSTILIVDAYGSPTITSDLATFDSFFGIPAPPSFTIVCPTGPCPAFDTSDTHHGVVGWGVETSLDVEYAHAMAPGANIVLVVASTSSGNAINSAEANAIQTGHTFNYPGAIVSQSFGIPEYLVHGNDAQIAQAESNYVTMQNAGMTVFASAGDSGATNGGPFANAGFPASSPLVTAVTGTQGLPYFAPGSFESCAPATVCTSGLATVLGPCSSHHTFAAPQCTPVGYGGEQVWNEPDFGAATGGAPSLFFGVPSFQNGLGLTSRVSADVAYNAAVNGGVLVYIGFLGGFFFVGGTSAGSPQWAAIAALADQAAGHGLGYLNNAIYTIGNNPTEYANDFHDITVGNNQLVGTCCGFNAATGWDPATGWGSPNVANLIPDLVANA